jgi:hypothetical protein
VIDLVVLYLSLILEAAFEYPWWVPFIGGLLEEYLIYSILCDAVPGESEIFVRLHELTPNILHAQACRLDRAAQAVPSFEGRKELKCTATTCQLVKSLHDRWLFGLLFLKE